MILVDVEAIMSVSRELSLRLMNVSICELCLSKSPDIENGKYKSENQFQLSIFNEIETNKNEFQCLIFKSIDTYSKIVNNAIPCDKMWNIWVIPRQ